MGCSPPTTCQVLYRGWILEDHGQRGQRGMGFRGPQQTQLTAEATCKHP